MSSMNELPDFLLARIAEDEAAATDEVIARASAGTVVLGPMYDNHPAREAIRDQVQEAVVDIHRERPWSSPWSPVRILAECAAKRRIVEAGRVDYEDALAGGDDTTSLAEEVLHILALPYADHPDYRPEWRP